MEHKEYGTCFLRFIKTFWALYFIHHSIVSNKQFNQQTLWNPWRLCTLKDMPNSAFISQLSTSLLDTLLLVCACILFIFLLNQHSVITITHVGAVLGKEVESVPYMTQPSSRSLKLHLFDIPPPFWPHCLGSTTKYWRWQWLSPVS